MKIVQGDLYKISPPLTLLFDGLKNDIKVVVNYPTISGTYQKHIIQGMF